MGLYSSRHIAASRGVAAAQFDRLLQNRHRPAAAPPRLIPVVARPRARAPPSPRSPTAAPIGPA